LGCCIGALRSLVTNRLINGTSVIVLAEIRRGIELKRRRIRVKPDRSIDGSRRCAPGSVIACCRSTSRSRKLGRCWVFPIPCLIDGLLAATAKVHGLTLVTRNVADIARTGVSLLDPFSA
jgi:predicted nucleic acid-binding protein